MDGLHGTFGKFNRFSETFGTSFQAVVNGTRFSLEPLEIMEGLELGGKTPGTFIPEVPLANKLKQEEKISPEIRNYTMRSEKKSWRWFSAYSRCALTGGTELLPKNYKPP